ncbi:hypothetical protein AB1Y20_008715 [Prymnesium parvum]|uniref:Myb-like domain-containing protein n=1 Tax=Prymnesium parvum TaxID=97485 RepID=A0AB34IU15_PRYPA
MGGAVPPSLKKMKTAPSCVGKPAPYALEASSSPECARPGSTGLTRYIGETSLSFSDDKGTEDEETLKIASSSQSKAGWTEAEDKVVLLAVRTFGTQWNAVSGQLVGRTADAVRNRWHRLQKRGHSELVGESAEDAAACRQLLAAAMMATTLVSPPEGQRSTSAPSARDPSSASSYTTPPETEGKASPPSDRAPLTQGGGSCLLALPTSNEVICLTGSDHGRARWTAHEDQVIQDGVKRWGCKWRQIAALLPGRSDSSIRNRWMRLLKAATATDEVVHHEEDGNGPLGQIEVNVDNATKSLQKCVEVADEALILLGFASQMSKKTEPSIVAVQHADMALS